MNRPSWSAAWRRLVSPKIEGEELERRLRTARTALPPPVIWLLGKVQSGKTSLVQALTGSTRAEIGNGFRPCTRTAQLYAFPSEEDCFLKFLDTRGLGEVEYDPAEDIARCEGQAHLLIVVMKAMDHAQQCVLAPLRAVRKRHPEWPVIALQTALHEGYPFCSARFSGLAGTTATEPAEAGTTKQPAEAGTTKCSHVLPYPYASGPFPPTVPHDLARSLLAQRQWFGDEPVRCVPVDFTQPEDGFVPADYGLDALWAAIEEAVPIGLRGMLVQSPARQGLRDEYFRTAHPHVVGYALAASGAGAVPVPLVDIPLVLAIQAKMFHAVASVYEQPMDAGRMAEVTSALGAGLVSRLAVREALKLVPVPGLGSGVSALYAGASTYALGCALCLYFSRVRGGDVPEPRVIRELYAEEFREAKQWLAERLKYRK